MSLVKYRLKEVATDFGVTPKDIAEVMGKFFEKPKSNTQVLTDVELNAVFDYMTQKNQIKSLEQVFAVKPTAPKAEAPKVEKKVEPKAEKKAEKIIAISRDIPLVSILRIRNFSSHQWEQRL